VGGVLSYERPPPTGTFTKVRIDGPHSSSRIAEAHELRPHRRPPAQVTHSLLRVKGVATAAKIAKNGPRLNAGIG
jgi:hypothetical protein